MAEGYSIEGEIYKIGEVEHVTERFSKREFILKVTETGNNGQTYEQFPKFELTRNLETLDDAAPGMWAFVRFNIRGRKYTKRGTQIEDSFTSLQAWSVDLDQNKQGGGRPTETYEGTQDQQPQEMTEVGAAGTDDDIPF